MNPKTLFDFHNYLYELVEKNKLARTHAFYPCSCSGISYLEEMLQNSRSHKAFVCLTDTSQDSTTRKLGGWFKWRVFTVFILCRYNTRSQDNYREKLGVCRELFRQLHSRFLIDEHDLHLLDVNRRASCQPDARSASQAGAGYKKAAKNGGDLYFLDPVYRHEHHKKKPRSRRLRFNVSWFISTQVLKEKFGELIGEEFSGLFDNLIRHEPG